MNETTSRLVADLLAAIEQRELRAQQAERWHPGPWRLDPQVETTMDAGRWVADAKDEGVLVANGDAAARFFVGEQPQAVLRQCRTDRRLVERHRPSWPNGGKPEYDTHWERTESGQMVEVRNSEPVPPYYCLNCGELSPCDDLADRAEAYGIDVDREGP